MGAQNNGHTNGNYNTFFFIGAFRSVEKKFLLHGQGACLFRFMFHGIGASSLPVRGGRSRARHPITTPGG